MLGDILRQEREKQNLSVKDVERETSIRSLYISSIEEGKYDAVPGEVYLKGFIRTYATFLKLDGAAMLKLYYEEKQGSAAAAEAAALPERAEESALAEAPERKSIREMRAEKQRGFGGVIKIAVGLLLVLCAGVGAYFAFISEAPEKPAMPKAKVAVPAQPPEKPAAAPAAKPKPAAAEGVEAKASLTGKCWLHVEADGKVLFEGILQKGEAQTWKAERELVITAGNAGALELVLNGKPTGKLGKNGEVVTKKFTGENGASQKK